MEAPSTTITSSNTKHSNINGNRKRKHSIISNNNDNNNNDIRNDNTATTITSADCYSRLATTNNQAVKSGRGSQAGWIPCPLCGRHSRKLFAMGRGIAAHLHAVHTPWKPGKVERQKRRRLALEQERAQRQHCNKEQISVVVSYKENETWEPTEHEIDAWNCKVLEIVKNLEDHYQHAKQTQQEQSASISPECDDTGTTDHKPTAAVVIKTGVDRNGKTIQAYRASLPNFIQAAADGDLKQLQHIIHSKETNQEIQSEINRRDRHLSTAEHWAAGGGHLECLKYLIQIRKEQEQLATNKSTDVQEQSSSSSSSQQQQQQQQQRGPQKSKIRRRDGKTALHFAARNGHLDCIQYLIDEQGHFVDETSGDGTTPFHLACFGGHLQAMEILIHQYGCNPFLANAWGCNAAHWVGMTKCESKETVRNMCRLLQNHGVSFVERQKQGHSALHKAAQRQNRHLIEWMAQTRDEGGAGLSQEDMLKVGEPDEGGHTPSQIWKSVGGDDQFADWMIQKGW